MEKKPKKFLKKWFLYGGIGDDHLDNFLQHRFIHFQLAPFE